jgi:hypothetical protein
MYKKILVIIGLVILSLSLVFILYGFQKNSFKYNVRGSYIEVQDKVIPVAKYFSETSNYLWGYINKEGEILVDFQFDKAGLFNDDLGVAIIRTREGEEGFINSNFQVITSINGEDIESIGYFSEGLADIKINGKWGYINSNLELSIDNIYDNVLGFKNGLARVYINSKQGFINKKGEYILENIEVNYDESLINYEAPLVGYSFKQNDKWGFIDHESNIIVEPVYDFVESISDIIITLQKDGKIGFINLETGFKLEPFYDIYTAETNIYGELISVSPPSSAENNSMLFHTKDHAKLVDLNNNELISFKKNDDYNFFSRPHNRFPRTYEDLMPIFNGKKWGYVNKNNKMVIGHKFNTAYRFHKSGYALVSSGRDYFHYIDKKGRRVSEDFYGEPDYSNPDKGYIVGRLWNKTYVVLNGKFEIIWRIYDS